jgi:hypothetical protein
MVGFLSFMAWFILELTSFGSLIAYSLLLQASANFTKCIGENSTPNSGFPRNAIPGPLTLTLEPSSKVESLFLYGESLILILNVIGFSVTRNYSKSYTVSIIFGGYVYILENSPVLSCMLFCNPPYPYGLCKSLIAEDQSEGI